MPAMASLASNLTLPKGLQTTSHLSQEMMARDQSPVIPAGDRRQMRAWSLRRHSFHPDQPTVFRIKRFLPTSPQRPQRVFGSRGRWVSRSSPLTPSFPILSSRACLSLSFVGHQPSLGCRCDSRWPRAHPHDHVEAAAVPAKGKEARCAPCPVPLRQYVGVLRLPDFPPLPTIWPVRRCLPVPLRRRRSVGGIQGSMDGDGTRDTRDSAPFRAGRRERCLGPGHSTSLPASLASLPL